MKRSFALFVCLVLLFLCTDVAASVPSVPEDAFEEDRLVLKEAVLPDIDPEGIVFEDQMWAAMGMEKPDDPAALAEEITASAQWHWISLSPDGGSAILNAQDSGVGYYGGKFRILYPSSGRGVPDEYNNLKRFFSQPFAASLGKEGVTWSPDGRYAAIFRPDLFQRQGAGWLDPILIDLSTGEMILTATYADKNREEGFGTVVCGTFSADSRSLYYMLYTAKAAGMCLCRYDIEADETEVCLKDIGSYSLPMLCETADRQLLILQSTVGKEPATIAEITPPSSDVPEWSFRSVPFDIGNRCWSPSRMVLSPKSGYAAAVGFTGFTQGIDFSLCIFRPEEDFRGTDRFIVIDAATDTLKSLTSGEIAAVTGQSLPRDTVPLIPWHLINAAVLSPDGEYLLLLTHDPAVPADPRAEDHLYLLRLEDPALREVRGIDPAQIPYGGANAFRQIIEWNCDTLLILTQDGLKACSFR